MTFTTITNVAYFHSIEADSVVGETLWTINKNARPGDTVLLYVCAPVSAIVATAIVSDMPYLDEDVNSEFFGSYFAEMENLKLLDVKVTRHQLRQEFPDWRYWTQPRNSVRVPDEYLPKLEKMLGVKTGRGENLR